MNDNGNQAGARARKKMNRGPEIADVESTGDRHDTELSVAAVDARIKSLAQKYTHDLVKIADVARPARYRVLPPGVGVVPPGRRRHVRRECLVCAIPFASEGRHNRLCDACRREPDWP